MLEKRHYIESDPPLKQAAKALDAKLLDKGRYYFPGKSGEDVKLNLSRLPVMEFNNGIRILFRSADTRDVQAPLVAKKFWKNLEFLDLPIQTDIEEILTSIIGILNIEEKGDSLIIKDRGVEVTVKGQWMIRNLSKDKEDPRKICINLIDEPKERTPDPILRYLEKNDIVVKEILRDSGKIKATPLPEPNPRLIKPLITLEKTDPRIFIKDLLSALDITYSQNVSITFPYAGVQVKALSNLISTQYGTPVFVDFGDLYGNAVSAIEKTGFKVVQIKPGIFLPEIVQKILVASGIPFKENPTFSAAERKTAYNTRISIPGFELNHSSKTQILLTRVPLPAELIIFLSDRGVKTVYFSPKTGTAHQ